MVMKKKKDNKTFLDSLWFNSIMSILAVALLVTNILNQKYILVVVWVVIAYHFLRGTIKAKEIKNEK